MKEQASAKPDIECYRPVRQILKDSDPSMLIKDLISREDGLYHILYSDTVALLQSVAHDFPELVKVSSIGKSYEGRDILVAEIEYPDSSSQQGDSFV